MNARPASDQISGGLLVAGVPATVLSVVLMFGSTTLFGGLSLETPEEVKNLVGSALVYCVVGLPVAWLTMFAIGIPLWRWATREGPITQFHATKLGATAGAIVGAIETFVAMPFAASFVGDQGDLIVFTKHIFDVVCTIGIGAICGPVANFFAGPLKAEPSEAG